MEYSDSAHKERENDNSTDIAVRKEPEGGTTSNNKKPRFIDKLKKFWSNPKNRIVVEAVLGVIVILVVGLILRRWYSENNNSGANNTIKSATTKSDTAVVETAPSILDGTLVPKALSTRHPLGVMVENHVDARPQSGLSAAGLVYEAIAEGGITRYLAFFSGYDIAKIGPIRSARTYYVDIAKGFNAYFAHVGGNYNALSLIKSINVLDLDQFANPAAYWRDTSRRVATEHTVYSSTEKLYSLAAKKQFTSDNTFTPLKFKVDAAEAARPASQKVKIEFSSDGYTDTFNYDPKTNTYPRSIGSLPDQDIETGKRIAPKNLILQEVTRSAIVTVINEKGYAYDLSSGGKVTIFQDGKQVIGTWKHPNDSDRTFYYDSTGKEIELNPGQTWVCLTHPDIRTTIE